MSRPATPDEMRSTETIERHDIMPGIDRERLARVLCVRRLPAMNLTDEARETLIQRGLYQAKGDVDAILREMLEPSEGMVEVLHMSRHDRRQWSAGVQHILDETDG